MIDSTQDNQDPNIVTIYVPVTDDTGFVRHVPKQIDLRVERQKFLSDNRDIIIRETDAYIESIARSMGYKDAVSASSYAGARNRFQKESTQFIIFRGACWDYLYDALDAMLAGSMAIPDSIEVLVKSLPKYEDFSQQAVDDIAARYSNTPVTN